MYKFLRYYPKTIHFILKPFVTHCALLLSNVTLLVSVQNVILL